MAAFRLTIIINRDFVSLMFILQLTMFLNIIKLVHFYLHFPYWSEEVRRVLRYNRTGAICVYIMQAL